MFWTPNKKVDVGDDDGDGDGDGDDVGDGVCLFVFCITCEFVTSYR